MGRLPRVLLAPVFVVGGWSTLQEPKTRAELAEPVLDAVEQVVPEPMQPSRTTMVQANAVAQIVAGIALPFESLAAPAAGILALTLIPATLGGHRFWEEQDPGKRAQQQFHFLKNVAILGGLLLVPAGAVRA